MPRGSMMNTILAIAAQKKEQHLQELEKAMEKQRKLEEQDKMLMEACAFGPKQFKGDFLFLLN